MEPVWESGIRSGERHFVGRERADGAVRGDLCEDRHILGWDGTSLERHPGVQFVHLSANVLEQREGRGGLVDDGEGDGADMAVIAGESRLDVDGEADAVCASPGVVGWDKGGADGGCDVCVVGVGATEDEDEVADVVGLEGRVVCGRHDEDGENVKERL